jgi:hypothetical protein
LTTSTRPGGGGILGRLQGRWVPETNCQNDGLPGERRDLSSLPLPLKISCPSRALLEWLDRRASNAVRRSLGGLAFCLNALLRSQHHLALNSVVVRALAAHMTECATLLALADGSIGGIAIRTELGIVQAISRCPVSPLEKPDLVVRTRALAGVWRRPSARFAQLLELMSARSLSIVDQRGEFCLAHIHVYSSPQRDCSWSIAEHAPTLLSTK